MNLFFSKKFFPLFLTQFLGALNDNFYKSALVVYLSYHLHSVEHSQWFVTMAGGLFILPFFLFSAHAGQLADKHDRSFIAKASKVLEIIVMHLAVVGFLFQSIWILLLALFLMGAQSAYFGPVKYSLLPQLLQSNELLKANAYVEAGTFLAILLGTLFGSLCITLPFGLLIISVSVVMIAYIGFLASKKIESTPAVDPQLKINLNFIGQSLAIIRHVLQNKHLFHVVLAISWFWLIGSVYLSQIPNYVKHTLHAPATVVSLFLTLFSVGIAIGSYTCNLLKIKNLKAVALALFLQSLFGMDLYFSSNFIDPMIFQNFKTIMKHPASLRILFDFLFISIFAGIFVVPLYTWVLKFGDYKHLSRIVAANNILNAGFMVMGAGLSLMLLSFQFNIQELFLTFAIANGVASFLIQKTLKATF